MTRLVAFLSVLMAAACSAQAPQEVQNSSAAATVFFGARIIPGDGSGPIEDGVMIVEAGKISQIGTTDGLPSPQGAVRVDLRGKTIVPVMVSLHGHPGFLVGTNLAAANYGRESILSDLNRYAYYGVGAVLALGTDAGDTAFQIREEQRRGTLGGARLFTAGRGITSKGGWPTVIPALKDSPYQISSEQEARSAVSEQAAKKVDVVKIWVDDNLGRIPKLTPELYRAVIDEAHKRGLRVFAHVFTLGDAKDLVASGIDGLAHSVRDRAVDDELITVMKEKNVFYVATLTAHESTFVYADAPAWLGEPSMLETYPAGLVAGLASGTFVDTFRKHPDLPKFRQQYAVAQKNLAKLAAAGVRIGFGTDTGTANRFVGYFEQRELELMVNAGLTPMQAITAATTTSAEILGASDLGTIAPGKSADFLVLSGNPLEKITNTREIAAIYQRGTPLDRAALKSGFAAQ